MYVSKYFDIWSEVSIKVSIGHNFHYPLDNEKVWNYNYVLGIFHEKKELYVIRL